MQQDEIIKNSLYLSELVLVHFKGKGYKIVHSALGPAHYISTGVFNGERGIKLTPINDVKQDEAKRIADVADILYESNDPDYQRGAEITPDLLDGWQGYVSSCHIASALDRIKDSSGSSSEKEKNTINLLRSGFTRALISEYSHLAQYVQNMRDIEKMEESNDNVCLQHN